MRDRARDAAGLCAHRRRHGRPVGEEVIVARVYVATIALLMTGCAAYGWDCVCYGGAVAQTHLINGQLVAEFARDQQ